MLHYTPTRGAFDAAKNIRNFVQDNKQVFWDILNPLLPFIIGLTLFDFIINLLFFPMTEEKEAFNLGQLVANYFYAALIISWHRVVIHGPDKYVAVNPLKPKKSELAFMGMAILVGISSVLFAIIFALAGMLGGPLGAVLGVCVGFGVAAYGAYKVCFYFPAKAAGADITLKQSFDLTKGYFWKLMGAGFLASIKMILIVIGYLIVMGLLAGVLFSTLFTGGSLGHIFVFVMALPIYVYFQPILTIIGVTALSNYYLYAIQNRPAADNRIT
jgi:hypothetical protein